MACRLLGRVLDLGCGKFASTAVWKVVEEAPASATVYALVDWVVERLCGGESAAVPGLARQLCAAVAARVPLKHKGKQSAIVAGLFFGQVVARASGEAEDRGSGSVLALAFQTTLFSLCAEIFGKLADARLNQSMNDLSRLLPSRSPPPVAPVLPAKKLVPSPKRVTTQVVGSGWRKAEAPAEMKPLLRQLGDPKKDAAEAEDGGRVRYDLMLDEELELPAVEPNPITSPQAYKNYKLLRYERQKRGLEEPPAEPASPRQWTAAAPAAPASPRGGDGPSSPRMGRSKGMESPRRRDEGPASPGLARRAEASPRGEYVRPPRSVRPASPTAGRSEAAGSGGGGGGGGGGSRVARSAKAAREEESAGDDFDHNAPDPLFCVGDLVQTAAGEEAEVVGVDARGRYSAKVFGERIVTRHLLAEQDLKPRARDLCWHCGEYFPAARLRSCGHCGAASKTAALASPKAARRKVEEDEQPASPRLTVMFDDISAAFGELAKWDEEH